MMRRCIKSTRKEIIEVITIKNIDPLRVLFKLTGKRFGEDVSEIDLQS